MRARWLIEVDASAGRDLRAAERSDEDGQC